MIEALTVENYLGNYIKGGLALDVSTSSTGLAIFEEGIVKTYAFSLDVEDSVLEYGLRIKEFLDALDEIIPVGSHFNIICIEAPLSLVNAKTNFRLMSINALIDYKIAKGDITCDEFLRVENSSWKKVLRTLTGVKPFKNVGKDPQKKEVIECLKRLKFGLANKVDEYKSWNAYMNSGYQDILDAVGVLMGAVNITYSENTVVNRTITVNFKVFDNLEDAIKFSKFTLREVDIPAQGLSAFHTGLKKTVSESTSFLYRGSDLGRFGVTNKIYDMFEEYFVLFNVEVKRKTLKG